MLLVFGTLAHPWRWRGTRLQDRKFLAVRFLWGAPIILWAFFGQLMVRQVGVVAQIWAVWEF